MAVMLKSLAVIATLLAPACATLLRRAADPCDCVNWQEAYKTGGVKCGDGYEYYVATSSGIPRFVAGMMLGTEFCKGFYKRINDNFCVNLDHDNKPDRWDSGQWCYVSSLCTSAALPNGTGSLRLKLCAKGRDKLLRDKTPAEVIAWAKSNDFETGLLLKMAYPVEKEAQWPLVKDAFLNSTVGLQFAVPDTAAFKRMSLIRRLGKPVILDGANTHPPFAVVQGSTAYLLDLNKQSPLNIQHPNSVTTVRCVADCKQ